MRCRFFSFGRAAELVRSRLNKRRCSAAAVWNALLGWPSWVAVEIRDSFLCSGFIHGISRTKQRARNERTLTILSVSSSLAHEVADFVKGAYYSIFFTNIVIIFFS